MKQNMTGVGKVEVAAVDATFSTITVDGIAVKVPTSAVADILKEGLSKLSLFTQLPSAPK